MNETSEAPGLADRVDAIELLLQQLVTVLDAEPRFTVDKLAAWCSIAEGRMRERRSATVAQLQALQLLMHRIA